MHLLGRQFNACKTALNGKYTNPWGNKICVAAAVVGSVRILAIDHYMIVVDLQYQPGLIRDALSCSASSLGDLDTLPYLDYGVRVSISFVNGCR